MHSAYYALRSITLTYFFIINVYHMECGFAAMIIHIQYKMWFEQIWEIQ